MRQDMHQLTRQMGEVRVEQQAIRSDVAQMRNEQAYNWAAWWAYHNVDPPQPSQP